MTVEVLVEELEERYPDTITSIADDKNKSGELDKRIIILELIREIKTIGGIK